MLTAVQPTKPGYRPYRVQVVAIRRVSCCFARITFTGVDLGDFGTGGRDQRIKVILPLPGERFGDFGQDDPDSIQRGEWYLRWRELPDHDRNPIRTYTVRAVRPAMAEIDVDFVSHGDTGPASAWVGRARAGDELLLVGPDATSPNSGGGIEWHPGSASRVLLVGDETALPAISAILETLEPGVRGHAIVEVPHQADRLLLPLRPGLSIDWIVRDRTEGSASDAHSAVAAWVAAHGRSDPNDSPDDPASELEDVDIDSEGSLLWEVPEAFEAESATTGFEDLYVWVAGEASKVKLIRRFLVSESGLDRHQVAFMGYWRAGRAEAS
ncbi:siderophore-interacting protein [Naasia lichenicola]|uniref:Siderophore-interacting protein n=1 Tax=Naasia lichenicola TaxID=2565933 RepID=A0A4V3WSL6_9MICO|nr:siderophore-interacting protein [Naasia lichenicola]THG28577.1 siderophore-interacting protein [Naasia lichenicola]